MNELKPGTKVMVTGGFIDMYDLGDHNDVVHVMPVGSIGYVDGRTIDNGELQVYKVYFIEEEYLGGPMDLLGQHVERKHLTEVM